MKLCLKTMPGTESVFRKYCVDQLNQHLLVAHTHGRLGRDAGGQSGL